MQKNFVSEVDKFLAAFDKKNPKKSDSQQREIKKYSRIFKLRDDPEAAKKEQDKIWEEF
jgi:hypothetical protein